MICVHWLINLKSSMTKNSSKLWMTFRRHVFWEALNRSLVNDWLYLITFPKHNIIPIFFFIFIFLSSLILILGWNNVVASTFWIIVLRQIQHLSSAFVLCWLVELPQIFEIFVCLFIGGKSIIFLLQTSGSVFSIWHFLW